MAIGHCGAELVELQLQRLGLGGDGDGGRVRKSIAGYRVIDLLLFLVVGRVEQPAPVVEEAGVAGKRPAVGPVAVPALGPVAGAAAGALGAGAIKNGAGNGIRFVLE